MNIIPYNSHEEREQHMQDIARRYNNMSQNRGYTTYDPFGTNYNCTTGTSLCINVSPSATNVNMNSTWRHYTGHASRPNSI